jgi:hypothetical protein
VSHHLISVKALRSPSLWSKLLFLEHLLFFEFLLSIKIIWYFNINLNWFLISCLMLELVLQVDGCLVNNLIFILLAVAVGMTWVQWVMTVTAVTSLPIVSLNLFQDGKPIKFVRFVTLVLVESVEHDWL